MSTRDWQRDMETCQKASPGPWRPGDDGRIYCSKGYYVATIYKLLTPDGLADDVATTNANMQLIAEAREALPYWLQRVRELEDDRNTEKRLRKDAEDKIAELEEKIQELKQKLKAQPALQEQGLPVAGSEFDHINKLQKDYFTEKMKRKDAESKCAELKAQCAVMREALEELAIAPPVFSDERLDYVEIQVAKASLEEAQKILQSDAGRELLERVKKLEAVAEAAQEFLDTIDLAERTGADVSLPPVQWQALYKLKQALAALDKEES